MDYQGKEKKEKKKARSLPLEILVKQAWGKAWVSIFFNMAPGVSDVQPNLDSTSLGPNLMHLRDPVSHFSGCHQDYEL